LSARFAARRWKWTDKEKKTKMGPRYRSAGKESRKEPRSIYFIFKKKKKKVKKKERKNGSKKKKEKGGKGIE
jgi:hypothetical protein